MTRKDSSFSLPAKKNEAPAATEAPVEDTQAEEAEDGQTSVVATEAEEEEEEEEDDDGKSVGEMAKK